MCLKGCSMRQELTVHFFFVVQERGIGNTSLSTFGVIQAVVEIILMLYPSSDLLFVCRMLHDQEQQRQGCLVCLGHSSAKHLPGTSCVVSSPFMIVEKEQSRHTYKRLNKASLQQSVFSSLIDLLNSYLMVSSVVGFYSLRVFEGFTPRKDDTTMTTVKMGSSGGQRCWNYSRGADVFGDSWSFICSFFFVLYLLFLWIPILQSFTTAFVDLSNICLWVA